MTSSRRQMEPVRVTAEFGEQHSPVANSEPLAVDEEPDELRPAEMQAPLTHSSRPTYEQVVAEGEQAYFHAAELEEQEGLSDATIAEYKKAGSRLIGAAALVPLDKHWSPAVPVDPFRLTMISDSLTKQAQAPEVRPYEDALSANTSSRMTDRKENLERLAGEYLTQATRIFLHMNPEQASAYISEDPKRLIAGAAVEAKLSADTAEYPIPEDVIKEDTDELLNQGPEAVVEFVEKHIDEPEFISKTGEIVLDELADAHRLAVAA